MKAVDDKIEGELTQSAVFRWEVNRVRTEIRLLALTLSRDAKFNSTAILFRGFGKSPLPENGKNKDRLNATILGAVNQDVIVIYQVTLKDLQFTDKNSAFFLRALFQSSNSGSIWSYHAAVTLITVHGSYFFFFIFLSFVCFFFRNVNIIFHY